MLAVLAMCAWCLAPAELPTHLWLEAEWFGPLRGANFSFYVDSRQERGAWALAGPDVAVAWTQGGESEFLSIAARADEPGEVVVARPIEVPAAGQYALWVRYVDYRGKREEFAVRVRQGTRVATQRFGAAPVVDELDPMKLFWSSAFGWDHASLSLESGPAVVELCTTGPTDARRQVDCLCLTTDAAYQPSGRDKPAFAAWGPLRAMRTAGMPPVEPLLARKSSDQLPREWKLGATPPAFLWSADSSWWQELKRAAPDRVDEPFRLDPPLLSEFLTAFRGKTAPVFGDPLSGLVWHIPRYPEVFADASPFLDWLTRHPDRRFGILLNNGEPSWPAGANRAAIRANLKRYEDRFVGFIAGENLAYASVDKAALQTRVRAARTRGEVLAALREANTAATRAKFADYFGTPMTGEEAWAQVVSCLSANVETYAHALGAWGARRIGHENTGTSPTLARRLAFLRGAARQFGARIVDYQSCNLGDAATIFSRQAYSYPATSRYVLDNSYDVWAGAGLNWALKDYLLFHLAGAEAFHHEQGDDVFWKPGGGAAGDERPIQLSPKGEVAAAVLRLAREHPRGTQVTPIAFLLDEAHGWAQERFQPGAFGLDPQWNPALLSPGRHEASIRGWFDLAYFPAPETQNEPATAIRQTYVNGVFGDLFDVIVTAPGHAAIAPTYPVLVAAGEVPLGKEWDTALRDYVQQGGTLVLSADQCGPGFPAWAGPAPVPAAAAGAREAAAFSWAVTGQEFAANRFRYTPLPVSGDRVLASAPDGGAIAVLRKQGRGQLILIGIPLGLGIDARPVPLLGLLLRHLSEGLVPVRVQGDVEWLVNRLDDGGWLISLLNNRGVTKPQHGVLPTDYREAQVVTLRLPFGVAKGEEWITGAATSWQNSGEGAALSLTVPAGGVRLVAAWPNR